jgi:hypothetical protein
MNIKTFLMTCGAMLICGLANAGIQVSDTINRSTETASVGICVSSGTPTLMDFNSVKNRTTIEIQNVASVGNIFCTVGSVSSSPAISVSPPNAHMITPNGGTWILSLASHSDNDSLRLAVWCIGDSISGCTNAVVTQFGKVK